jgi:hypothetical protein
MGYTEYFAGTGRDVKELITKEIGSHYEILRIESTPREYDYKPYFLACKDRETGNVFAAVFLTNYRSGVFGYKDMSEDMGPSYYGVSDKFLDLLSEPFNEWAAEWRAKCRELNAKPKPVKVKAGDVVKFNEPLKFTSGRVLSELEFITGSTFRDAMTGGRYRVSNWRRMGHEVVKAAANV